MNFNGVSHYKPSILGYSYFWKHPYISWLFDVTSTAWTLPVLTYWALGEVPPAMQWRAVRARLPWSKSPHRKSSASAWASNKVPWESHPIQIERQTSIPVDPSTYLLAIINANRFCKKHNTYIRFKRVVAHLMWGSRNVIFWSAHFINCPGSESLEVVSLKLFICAKKTWWKHCKKLWLPSGTLYIAIAS